MANKENYDVNGVFGSLSDGSEFVIADIALYLANNAQEVLYSTIDGKQLYMLKFSSIIRHPEQLNRALETKFNAQSTVWLNVALFGIKSAAQLKFWKDRLQKGTFVPSAVGILKGSKHDGVVQLNLELNTPKTLHIINSQIQKGKSNDSRKTNNNEHNTHGTTESNRHYTKHVKVNTTKENGKSTENLSSKTVNKPKVNAPKVEESQTTQQKSNKERAYQPKENHLKEEQHPNNNDAVDRVDNFDEEDFPW